MARTRKTNRDPELVEALNGQVGLHLRYNRETRQLVLCDGPDGDIQVLGLAIQVIQGLDDDGSIVNLAAAGEAAAANANLDDVLTAVYTAEIGASSVIPTAFSCTLPTDLTRIVLVPRGDVYWKIGAAASADTLLLPAGGIDLRITKTIADTIQVYADTVDCDLLVYQPRN